MVFITIVTGAYKPTYILGASHCIYIYIIYIYIWGSAGLVEPQSLGIQRMGSKDQTSSMFSGKKRTTTTKHRTVKRMTHMQTVQVLEQIAKSHTQTHTPSGRFWEHHHARNKTKFNPRPKLPSKKPLELLILHKLLVEFRWMTGSSLSPMLGCPNRGAWKPSNKIV